MQMPGWQGMEPCGHLSKSGTAVLYISFISDFKGIFQLISIMKVHTLISGELKVAFSP